MRVIIEVLKHHPDEYLITNISLASYTRKKI